MMFYENCHIIQMSCERSNITLMSREKNTTYAEHHKLSETRDDPLRYKRYVIYRIVLFPIHKYSLQKACSSQAKSYRTYDLYKRPVLHRRNVLSNPTQIHGDQQER